MLSDQLCLLGVKTHYYSLNRYSQSSVTASSCVEWPVASSWVPYRKKVSVIKMCDCVFVSLFLFVCHCVFVSLFLFVCHCVFVSLFLFDCHCVFVSLFLFV